MNLATYKNILVWWRTKTSITEKGSFNEDLYLKVLKAKGMNSEADKTSLFQFALRQI